MTLADFITELQTILQTDGNMEVETADGLPVDLPSVEMNWRGQQVCVITDLIDEDE